MAANKQFIAKNGLDNNNNNIINVSDPIANTDAANKRYADTKLPNTKDISSVSLTSSSLTITKADATFVNTTIPTWNQSTTGNAATATKLITPRTINGVPFDGSGNISTPANTSIVVTDNRKIVPNDIPIRTVSSYFTTKGGLETTSSNALYGDFIALNSYSDSSGGSINGLFFQKSSQAIYHYFAPFGSTNPFPTPKQIAYTDGNVASATKLSSAKTISTTGDATWSVSFDGVNNVSSTLTLSNTGVTSGTYTKVTVNTKGLITAAENLTEADIPNLNVSKIIGLGTSATANIGTNLTDISNNQNLFLNTFQNSIQKYSKTDNIDCNSLSAGTKFLISIWSLNAPPIDGLSNLDSLIYGQNSYGDKDAFYYIETKSLTASNKIQTAIGQLSAVMYIRTCVDNMWSEWVHSSTSPNVFQNTTEDYPNLAVLPDGKLKRSNKQLGNVAEKNVNEPYGVPTLDGYGKIQSENLPVITYQGPVGDVQLNSNTYVSAQDIVTLNSAARYAGDTTDYVPLPSSAYIDYGTQDPKTATNVTLNIIDSSGNLFTTDMRKSNSINTLRRLAMIF